MIEGLLAIAAGLYCLLARRWAARMAVRQWQRSFPRASVSESGYRAAFVVVGLLVLGVGLLSLFGVIHDK